MYAYSNILVALLQRGKTGQGCRIDVSMLESMVEWMGFPLYCAFDGASARSRAGASRPTIYPYGPFTASDGRTVMLGLQNEREWQLFCDIVLRAPRLAVDERLNANTRRVGARAELQAINVEAFSGLTIEKVVARLEDAQIANANVHTMNDV
jgi:itaconate CoA-transferase